MTTKPPTPGEAVLRVIANAKCPGPELASIAAQAAIDAWCAQLGVDRETAERVLREATKSRLCTTINEVGTTSDLADAWIRK